VTEETPPITCLIADDHEVVREGLRLALSRTPHIRVVGEAADGEAAVALADRRRPDIVIMDVRMGVMDGFEAAAKIRDGASNAAVLFFTAHAERNLLTRGREAGARPSIASPPAASSSIPVSRPPWSQATARAS
jgi:DNA-binding NarL/FixJ family response regulator